MILNKIFQQLPKDEHVYITGHVHPDGDCLGATLALYNLFLQKEYNVTVVLEEKPETYSYLSGFDQIMDYSNFIENKNEIIDSVYSLIVMDSGDLTRIAPFIDLFEQARMTVNIDHHASNTEFAQLNYVKVNASSTCEMVGEMLREMEGLNEVHLTRDIAASIYTGLIYDTGVFKHSNTNEKTHIIAAALIKTGIDFTWITNRLFFTRSMKAIKAMEIALNHLEVYKYGHIVTTIISFEDMENNQLDKSATEGVVSMLNEIENSLVSVFFLEVKKDFFKVSFRSNSKIDVCQLAKIFGGGGHIKASGCSCEGSALSVKESVLKELILSYERNY